MCQTVAAGMQHDGDLGAIVRSAGGCSVNPSSPRSDFPPPTATANSSGSGGGHFSGNSAADSASPARPQQMMPAGSFMELISGGGGGGGAGLIPDLSSLPHNFSSSVRVHHHQQQQPQQQAVKCEPADFDQLFSSGRSLAFMDDHIAGGGGLFSPAAAAASAASMSSVKSEIESLELVNSGFDCGSPSSPAAGGAAALPAGAVKAEPDLGSNPICSSNSAAGKHQGSKRSRKMQQKRIVCVPVAGGGKPTGEVLPSDMWAWRKYGQKPIKGSPYPRGYYRCSSSKGCSARKQVERCRNDPTMLIITYTSEHNHPWPAHRNSLAGTTRIRPMAAAAAAAAAASQATTSGEEGAVVKPDMKAGMTEASLSVDNPFVSIVNSDHPMQIDHHHPQQQQQLQQQPSFQLVHQQQQNVSLIADMVAGFDNTSRSSSQDEDFFSELEELPELSSILEKGFLQYKPSEDDEGGSGGPAAGGSSRASVDPFNIFSWSSDATTLLKQQQQQQQQQMERMKKKQDEEQ